MGAKRTKKLVLAGAGGHAKVVADIVRRLGGYELAGTTDSRPEDPAARGSGLKMLGTDDALPKLRKEGVACAAVGVGSIKDTSRRRKVRELLEGLGFELPVLVHPAAAVAPSARLGPGCQVMAGAVINPGAVLGKNCVVNTGAIVEHDCRLGAEAFVGPGAVLGGGVVLEDGAFVGMGASVLQGVRVGARAVVGAGSVVLSDVPPSRTAVGAPARLVTR